MNKQLVMSSKRTVEGYQATVHRYKSNWVVTDFDQTETKTKSFLQATKLLSKIMNRCNAGLTIVFYGYDSSEQI